jgi:hypothetical protein
MKLMHVRTRNAAITLLLPLLTVVACQQTTPVDEPKVVDLEVTQSVTALIEGRSVAAQQFSVPEITQDVIATGGVYAKVRLGAADQWIDLPYSTFERCFFGENSAVCGITYAVAYSVGTVTFNAIGIVPTNSNLLDLRGTRIRLFFAEPAR